MIQASAEELRRSPHPVAVGANGQRRLRYQAGSAFLRLVRAVRRSDIVVCGSEIGAALSLGIVAARIARRPVAAIIHAGPSEAADAWLTATTTRVNRAALRRLDVAICVAADLADEMTTLGLPACRAVVIRNTVDVDLIRRRAEAPRRTALGLHDRPYVVSLGRLANQKGFDVLIRAHAVAQRAGADHDLVLLGEGPDRPSLARLAAALEVSDSVHLVGHVAEPHPIVRDSALFCSSSRYEGASLALLEALALEKPVVATRCGSGTVDALQDGRFGDLVPVDDHQALGEAITRHLARPEILAGRAEAAAQSLEPPDAAAGRYLDVLTTVVQRRDMRRRRVRRVLSP